MKWPALFTLLSLLFLPVTAEDLLPSAFPLSRYKADWENSPFNRVVVKTVEQRIASTFAKSIVLEGVVNDDTEGLTAYLKDKAEGSFFSIGEKASEDQPYWILSTDRLDDPRETSILITNGEEEAKITYEQNSWTKKIEEIPPAETPGKKDPKAEKTTTPPESRFSPPVMTEGTETPVEPNGNPDETSETEVPQAPSRSDGKSKGPKRNDILFRGQ